MFFAPPSDGLSDDQVHDHKEAPIRSDTAVVEPGNIGMFQTSQDLPFGVKSLRPVADFTSHQLDGDLMLELPIGPFSTIDLAHAARAQQFHYTVCTDSSARGEPPPG